MNGVDSGGPAWAMCPFVNQHVQRRGYSIALSSSLSFPLTGLHIPCPCHLTCSASSGRGLPPCPLTLSLAWDSLQSTACELT